MQKYWLGLILAAALLAGRVAPRDSIAGVIHFEGGKTQAFADVASLIFSLPDGGESIPQNVNEWPFVYDRDSVSRSAPLAWLRSMEVVRHETKSGYRCLFNAVLSIETVSGVVLESPFKTLEWIRVKTDDGSDRTFYFASGDRIQIRKIVFKSR